MLSADVLPHPLPSPEAEPAAPPAEPTPTLDEQFLAFARERPVTCVVGALALGFVLGKLAARF